MTKQKVSDILIDSDWCKGCEICVHFCPKNVLALSKDSKAIVKNLDATYWLQAL